jgi:hypothetical protein
VVEVGAAQAGVGRVRYPNAIVDVAGENLDLILNIRIEIGMVKWHITGKSRYISTPIDHVSTLELTLKAETASWSCSNRASYFDNIFFGNLEVAGRQSLICQRTRRGLHRVVVRASQPLQLGIVVVPALDQLRRRPSRGFG